jgi:DNA-binding transcriptional LysR family regulator
MENLEERLGVRLLSRTTRRIQLTEAGEEFYRRGVRLLTEIAEAEQIAAEYGDKPQGLLKIHCPVMIGLHKMTPLFPDFIKKYPKLKIHLDVSDDRTDLNALDHDVIIFVG